MKPSVLLAPAALATPCTLATAREAPQDQQARPAGGQNARYARFGDVYKAECAVCHGESLKDIEQPVVDLTPSPAVSSLISYHGEAFRKWRGHLVVATLKASDMYRMEFDGNNLVEREVLIENLARIRDVEQDRHGITYLLLEHSSGSKIVKLVPVT